MILTFCLVSSCEKDFEEINVDPFSPTQTEIGPLFNGVIESLTLRGNEQLYLNNEILYPLTQQAALSAPTFQNPTIGLEEIWERYYLPLTNIRDIESRIENYEGDPAAMNNIRAMLKTVLAYKTFKVTDLFGDIPFFEAGKGFEGVDFVRPVFDDQETIYKFLLEELQWVNDNANLETEPITEGGEAYVSLNGFDNLFQEDMLMWVKFANSLRLRHAIRMVEKDPAFANPIIQEILDNDLPLIEEGEDIQLIPSALGWVKNWTFWSFNQHRKLRMGTTIWNQMSETDAIDGSGIYDSRARIFFETNNNNEWAPFPQNPDDNTTPSGGSPYQGSRDFNYNLKGQANIYAPLNYYLIRDEHDVPELLFTAAEIYFLKAEAYYRGLGVAANENEARSQYDRGIGSSILFWHAVAASTEIWDNQPPALPPNGQFFTINHPNVKFTGGEDPLKLIYTQRWIDAFRQPWEAYALSRRTQNTPVEGDRPMH
ncbi:MAG: SusD/RagB family nutrient-binding outer membrane lipoprotein, partial [Saprospiraceae bacterium]